LLSRVRRFEAQIAANAAYQPTPVTLADSWLLVSAFSADSAV